MLEASDLRSFARRVRACAAVLLAVSLAPPASAAAGAGRATEVLDHLGAVRVGEPAPWFALEDARDLRRTLNRTRLLATPGIKKLALVFFASWCEPCREGLRMLGRRAKDLEKAGVHVVLVDYREPADKALSHARALGSGGFTVAIDKFGEAARAYGVERRAGGQEKVALPRTFVLSTGGRVLAIFGREGPDYLPRILRAR